LRIPEHIRGAGNGIGRLVSDGETAQGLEAFMEMHGISPWATFSLDGCSVLGVSHCICSLDILTDMNGTSVLYSMNVGTFARCYYEEALTSINEH
jgi:hypothetical protein